jgi:hypothetical protein
MDAFGEWSAAILKELAIAGRMFGGRDLVYSSRYRFEALWARTDDLRDIVTAATRAPGGRAVKQPIAKPPDNSVTLLFRPSSPMRAGPEALSGDHELFLSFTVGRPDSDRAAAGFNGRSLLWMAPFRRLDPGATISAADLAAPPSA